MSVELDRLTAKVAENSAVIASAETLLANLAEEIRNNINDSAALIALADTLENDDTELSAAIVANTPAGPPPAPAVPASNPDPAAPDAPVDN